QQHERFHDLAGRTVIVSMGFDAQGQQQGSRYYGVAGRQTSSIDDIDPSLNQHHDYDHLDRLTSSQRGDPQTSRTDYAYDLSGNRSEKIKDRNNWGQSKVTLGATCSADFATNTPVTLTVEEDGVGSWLRLGNAAHSSPVGWACFLCPTLRCFNMARFWI
ncbi:MAG: hypothetical protein WAW41_11090, partial [Methylobacter sp.]